jgi:8-oxo-dGTP pyrophosphatase MutT (NUDIX family)
MVATMPTPPFITELRSLVGHRLLWLATASAVVLDDEGHVLLGRRADTGGWALPGGIIDPAEQPADAAVRECLEETGVVAVPEALTSVTVSQPKTYANGDQVQYLELTFRCRAVGGEAHVNDEESLEVRWCALDALPELDGGELSLLTQALKSNAGAAYSFSGLLVSPASGRPSGSNR